MPRSLSLVIVHAIFSTEERCPRLDTGTRSKLLLHLATVTRIAGCECYWAGGVADHGRLAIRLSRSRAVAALQLN